MHSWKAHYKIARNCQSSEEHRVLPLFHRRRVSEDDIGTFTTQFQSHTLDSISGRFSDKRPRSWSIR